MKKLIIFGGIGLLILGGGGFFAWKVLAAKPAVQVDPKKDDHAKTPAVEGEAKAHGEEEEDEPSAGGKHGAAEAPTVMIYQKIVNLDKKNTYLKVELHILFRDPELGKAVTGDKPTPEASEIRATLLELLSGKTLEDASDLETRESVRKEIKDKLNEKFAPKPPKPGEKEDPKLKKPKKPIKDVLVVDWAISA